LPYVASFIVQISAGKFADYVVSLKRWRLLNIRRLFAAAGNVLPAISLALLCLGPSRMICVILLIASQGFGGFSIGGVSVNHIDLSPKFAGVIYGLGNTAATLPGIFATLVNGFILETSHSWSLIFALGAGIQIFGVLIFVLFGSTTPLNLPNEKKTSIMSYTSFSEEKRNSSIQKV